MVLNVRVPRREDDDRVLGATSIDRWCSSTSKAVGEPKVSLDEGLYHTDGLAVAHVVRVALKLDVDTHRVAQATRPRAAGPVSCQTE